ncbi:MAG: type 1 glutamine amidotransferase-like domain-containing protein [bacterium]|nr:type 1 glutamine amidotransferase-like domain-containing protein [bacterium]
MTDRHIVAMGGGGFSSGSSMLDRYALSLVDADRPKVCFVPTASGDDAGYTLEFYQAYGSYGCEPHVLNLFSREVDDIAAYLLGMDMVYVGGGSTANLLAVWRLHDVGKALEEAWYAGVVLSGLSAGANCWFDASTTDSFLMGKADPLLDGLGFVPGSYCPHYSSEPERRPSYLEMVATGKLPAGYACEDGTAVHFAGTDLRAAVSVDGDAQAYRVARLGDGATEEALQLTTPS